MANIVVAKAFWAAAGNATFMQPGEVHNWIWGLGNPQEAITITAFAFAAGSHTGVIIVEDLRISQSSEGLRLAEFKVRNVGAAPIEQYGMTGSFIS